jgi:hypothetical protein
MGKRNLEVRMKNLESRGVYALIHGGLNQFVWQISPLRNATHRSGRNDNNMDSVDV